MNAVIHDISPLESWIGRGVDPAVRGEVPWLRSVRQRALARVRGEGVPTAKHEAWRYTALTPLLRQPFAPVAEGLTALDQEDLGAVLVPVFEAFRAVLVNGRFMAHLSGDRKPAPRAPPQGGRSSRISGRL